MILGLIIVWLAVAVLTAAGLCVVCLLFGNREAVHAITPQAPTVVLRPAALERSTENTGLMQKARRLAHGDGPETRTAKMA
jgi:hypothetical protein